jgi:hypothetical protein
MELGFKKLYEVVMYTRVKRQVHVADDEGPTGCCYPDAEEMTLVAEFCELGCPKEPIVKVRG